MQDIEKWWNEASGDDFDSKHSLKHGAKQPDPPDGFVPGERGISKRFRTFKPRFKWRAISNAARQFDEMDDAEMGENGGPVKKKTSFGMPMTWDGLLMKTALNAKDVSTVWKSAFGEFSALRTKIKRIESCQQLLYKEKLVAHLFQRTLKPQWNLYPPTRNTKSH